MNGTRETSATMAVQQLDHLEQKGLSNQRVYPKEIIATMANKINRAPGAVTAATATKATSVEWSLRSKGS